MKLFERQKRAWAQIDLSVAEHNFRMLGKNICCVVKANAYGHGAIQLGLLYEKIGADYLAVSNIEEAIQLRKANISLPILILGYTPIECACELAEYDLEQTVYNLDYALELNKAAVRDNVSLKIHIKIDTGMGRIGFQYHENANELNQVIEACSLLNLIPIGIFTHFAISDEGINEYTKKQFNYFEHACAFLKERGISFKIKHCSNSAAIVNYPNFHLDMVRAGLLLYGINPTQNDSIDVKPVLSLWSVVSNVKRILKGDSVSYGRTFIAQKEMTIATIPVGYADGFWRSNQGHRVYINGCFCKIIGRVCMDQIMVECQNAKIGDLVEIYGEHISIKDVAEYNRTIPYEILCSVGERIPRVYIKKGKIVKVIDKLM